MNAAAKVYGFIKQELGDLAGFFKSKIGYLILTSILETLRAKLAASHPDWVLPSADEILMAGAALVGAHTLTDVVSALKGGKLDAVLADLDATKAALAAHATDIASIKVAIPSAAVAMLAPEPGPPSAPEPTPPLAQSPAPPAQPK